METWSERVARQMHAKQKLCRVCHKVCYDSEAEAAQVIREYRSRIARQPYYLRGESPAYVPKRSYLDPRCGMWHVTSQRVRTHPPVSTAHPYPDPDSAMPLRLPAPPALRTDTAPQVWLEEIALGLRDEIRRQGAGLRLPGRRALERHYAVSWTVLAAARELLVETGWLGAVQGRGGVSHLTRNRIHAERSQTDSASLGE